jgi:hypothetical protein
VRHRFADRTFASTEATALVHGDSMSAALRQGAGDDRARGMIAVIGAH